MFETDRKLRLRKGKRGDNRTIRVEQLEGVNDWIPLKSLDYATNDEAGINRYEINLRHNYGSAIVNSCFNCGAIAENESQRKCRRCGEKLSA